MITHEPQTWHYGLVAQWWEQFKEVTPEESAYHRAVIERYGEPALDLASGTYATV